MKEKEKTFTENVEEGLEKDKESTFNPLKGI
jgi:hypothetical protein